MSKLDSSDRFLHPEKYLPRPLSTSLIRLIGKDLVKAKWEVFYDLKAAVEKRQELTPEYLLKSTEPPDLLALYSQRHEQRKTKKQ